MLKNLAGSIALMLFISFIGLSQEIKTPRPSPNASVTQTVGITEVTIDYCSPGVKGRTIWGELVPFNEIWRTGANEVTSITFSEPVKISGKELKAGTYGIHTIPRTDEWDILFSGDTKIKGGSTFDEKKEVLRIKVTPEETSFNERMTFTFTNTTDNSTTVTLLWDKLKVSFDIETDTETLTMKKLEEQLSWGPAFQAANYCLQNDVNLEKGLNWIEASILFGEVYWNTRIKAQLQNKLGMNAEAIKTMEKAIELGSQMDSAPFDFENMKKLLAEWRN
jgi:hypothetical protein